MPRILRLVVLAALTAVALAVPLTSAARASSTQESTFQDDDKLIYSQPSAVYQTLRELKTLGVDRVRITLIWRYVAPHNGSTQRPSFDATDPSAYPTGAWDHYDTVIRAAQSLGIGVNLNVTDPAPRWALRAAPRRYHYLDAVWEPDARLFGDFVRAVGRRYSGTYIPPSSGSGSNQSGCAIPIICARKAGGSAPDALPRVNYWSIWNEPNFPEWLAPQTARAHDGRMVESAAHAYRLIVDNAYAALSATDHGSDTILIGELAPGGITASGPQLGLKPLRFLRALYCVDRHYRPLHGIAAYDLGCPTSVDRRRFRAAHPGLFHQTGFAQHPYTQSRRPDSRSSDPDLATLADIPRYERRVDTLMNAYGAGRHGGMPVYLTEYGYQTHPPDPYAFANLSQQAAWINQAEYMTFRDGHVRTLTQYQLNDAGPRAGVPKNSPQYWSTFQAGLEFQNGRHKPAYDAYRLPIYLPAGSRHHRRQRFLIWGMLRPADVYSAHTALVQWSGGHGRYRTLGHATARNSEGYFFVRFAMPGSGLVRLVWTDPYSGQRFASRSTRVTVVR